MRKLRYLACSCVGFALLSSAARAAVREGAQDVFAQIQEYGVYLFAAFVILFGGAIYFMKSQDRRQTILQRVVEGRKPVHSVSPDTLVAECVRRMTADRIGALIVTEGDRLTGIFTERDALNRVLAAGLDPTTTRVSEVMTKDPYCISPGATVGDAMAVVTSRRFRHLPIVENGKVLAVISSGDLTHWLVHDRLGDVRNLVRFASQS